MKIEYDPQHDIMNIEISAVDVCESCEIDGLIIDYGANGEVVSVEILDISQRTDSDPLNQMDFSIVKDVPQVAEEEKEYKSQKLIRGE
jgi:uncharacterized protein YuzE